MNDSKLERRKMNATRSSKTHTFEINGHKGYLTVGEFEDGTPGEVFIKISKQGSTLDGVMDAVAVLTSMALQFHVPLSKIVEKFRYSKFEPSGMTKNPEIPTATSILDYIFNYIGMNYLENHEPNYAEEYRSTMDTLFSENNETQEVVCSNCGSLALSLENNVSCPNCSHVEGSV